MDSPAVKLAQALKLYGLAILAFACMVLVFMAVLPDVGASVRARHWIPVTGTIIESREIPKSKTSSKTYPRIRYTYEHGGQTYQSKQVRFGAFGNNEAASVVAKYPQDGNVTIFIDPQDPSEAVLEPEFQKDNLWALAIFAICVASILWCVRTGRQLKQDAALQLLRQMTEEVKGEHRENKALDDSPLPQ